MNADLNRLDETTRVQRICLHILATVHAHMIAGRDVQQATVNETVAGITGIDLADTNSADYRDLDSAYLQLLLGGGELGPALTRQDNTLTITEAGAEYLRIHAKTIGYDIHERPKLSDTTEALTVAAHAAGTSIASLALGED